MHAFPGHIACDSRSLSEIVVPVLDAQGRLIAVFDVDATELAAFDENSMRRGSKASLRTCSPDEAARRPKALAFCLPLAARAALPGFCGGQGGVRHPARLTCQADRRFKPGWYRWRLRPRPDPRFAKVAVEAFGETGVCVVQGVSS